MGTNELHPHFVVVNIIVGATSRLGLGFTNIIMDETNGFRGCASTCYAWICIGIRYMITWF
jgi:hypothetical protein